MWKKIIWIFSILILLIVVGLFVSPFLFKNKIITTIKEQANQNIHAKLDFEDIDLSVLKNFPNLTLTINKLNISGKEPFENTNLFSAQKFVFSIDLLSLFGENIKIKQIELMNPEINIIILKDGKANYDIAIVDSTKSEEIPQESANSFTLSLKKYLIQNARISYLDETMNLKAKLFNFNHEGTGDFTQDIVTLKTVTSTDSFYISYEGIPYFNYISLNANCNLELDMVKSVYSFKENEFTLNNLPLFFNGNISMPNEQDINMDFTLKSSKSDFKSILSLIPVIYAKDFENIQTKGEFSFSTNVKGTYNEQKMPAYNVALKIDNAMFKYPDLPASVNNINVDLIINNPDGIDDHTVVDLKKLYFTLADNPINIKMLTKNPVSDPFIDGQINAQIDLQNIAKVVPLSNNEKYEGNITADITLSGKLSDIENENFNNFKSTGSLILLNFNYITPDFPETKIGTAYFNFSPQNIDISKFIMTSGQSDISLEGQIFNYLGYYLKNEPLQATFSHSSNFLNLNEWMSSSTSESTQTTDTTSSAEPMGVIEIPGNIDFTFSSNIGKVLFENKEIKNIIGIMSMSNKELNFGGIKAEFLEGTFMVRGAYNTQNPKKPTIDFSMDIKRFSLPETYKTITSIQKLAPIIDNSSGYYSTSVSFKSDLTENMEPDLKTMNGQGKLITHDVIIQNSGVFGKLADQFKMDQFKTMTLNNVHFSFEIKDGKIELIPFDFNVGETTINVSGYSTVEQNLNFKMNVTLPTSELKEAKAITSLLGNFSGIMPKAVVADVLVTGTALDPKVSVNFKEMLTSTTDDLKEKATEELNKLKNEAEAKAKEELAKKEKELRDKAQAEADKIMKEAEQRANQIRSEGKKAAEKIRSEGESLAQKTENEAKNPVAKIAAKEAAKKIRDDANKKADAVIKESNQKADDIIKTAKNKVDKLSNP